jgi:hypothetical protein
MMGAREREASDGGVGVVGQTVMTRGPDDAGDRLVLEWGQGSLLGGDDLQPVFTHELAGAGDVLADVGEQAFGVQVGDPELRSPAHEHGFAIGQQAVQPVGDGCASMTGFRDRQAQRQRHGLGGVQVAVVNQANLSAATVEDSQMFAVHEHVQAGHRDVRCS